VTIKNRIFQYLKNEYQNLKHKYILIPLLVILIYRIIYVQYYTDKINNCDYEIISCKVYKVGIVSKNPGNNIYFKYRINGKEYDECDKVSNIYRSNFQYFLIDKNVPLLVCKSDPKYYEILLLPIDFAERNLPYPDSLRIYLEYLK
jgi:hypothetical protein